MHSLSVRRRSTRPLRTCMHKQGAGIAPIENTDGPPQRPLEQASCRRGYQWIAHAPCPDYRQSARQLPCTRAIGLLAGPEIGSNVACGSVDCGYDAEWIRALDGPHCTAHGQKSHRTETRREWSSTALAIQSSCSFNKNEQHRRVAIATSN
jgi:hypothetical protein